MCGFAGLLGEQQSAPSLRSQAETLVETLAHRGPDDRGIWTDPACGIALGHRRLAVIDTSPQGHQPMTSASGRFVIAYNGEIYNFQQLRKQLDGPWRGSSDTEVLLGAFERWDVLPALKRLNGMFAFALWDRRHRQLFLARDRMGEKPLYYAPIKNGLAFASELKALRPHPDVDTRMDPEAVALYFRLGYIPAPHTIYQGVSKLPAGCLLVFGPDGPRPVHRYWDYREISRTPQRSGPEEETVESLDTALRKAAALRSVADVPLGALLSGGIDSTLVVAMLAAQSRHPVQTFTVGFREQEYDEAASARRVAHHLGTDHHELLLTPDEATGALPRLTGMYDEPFADPSALPTFLVSELARRRVTVVLSGDGGDELFGGYGRYQALANLWPLVSRVPRALRGGLASLIRFFPAAFWSRVFQLFKPLLPPSFRIRTEGEKRDNLAGILESWDPEALYLRLMSCWKDPSRLVRDYREPALIHQRFLLGAHLPDPILRAMHLDAQLYLPDDILVKVDRASMAVGLEARIPFLDPQVMEFAWSLPLEAKRGKRLLRRLATRYVPREWTERPKQGFAVPLDSWLRGPLRAWAHELLRADRMKQQGWLQVDTVQQRWQEHLEGRRDWQTSLWAVLMFQSWMEDFHP